MTQGELYYLGLVIMAFGGFAAVMGWVLWYEGASRRNK